MEHVMVNYFTFEDSEDVLSFIDKSIKKVKLVENKKYPYAVILHPKSAKNISLDNFTYLPKDGFKSIPIIRYEKAEKNTVNLAYSEKELISFIKS